MEHRLVKDAKRIMVSDLEYNAASRDKIRCLAHEWKGVNLETFQYKETRVKMLFIHYNG
ncbi:hypothetical protein [Veillonella criceti]|uniref:Uncharacterized protein n=1 Tax=Veillonella criceti TaxID=103891 RepID=A0A380NMN9_9FIRM|nr:hypothetical protein [Veillonella criceti]SUP44651.1 Uncharacterised protein [Veillonella criceti]